MPLVFFHSIVECIVPKKPMQISTRFLLTLICGDVPNVGNVKTALQRLNSVHAPPLRNQQRFRFQNRAVADVAAAVQFTCTYT